MIVRLFCSEEEFSKHAAQLKESANAEALTQHMDSICEICSDALFKTHRRLLIRADLTDEVNELKNKGKVVVVNEQEEEERQKEDVEQYLNVSYDIYKESVLDQKSLNEATVACLTQKCRSNAQRLAQLLIVHSYFVVEELKDVEQIFQALVVFTRYSLKRHIQGLYFRRYADTVERVVRDLSADQVQQLRDLIQKKGTIEEFSQQFQRVDSDKVMAKLEDICVAFTVLNISNAQIAETFVNAPIERNVLLQAYFKKVALPEFHAIVVPKLETMYCSPMSFGALGHFNQVLCQIYQYQATATEDAQLKRTYDILAGLTLPLTQGEKIAQTLNALVLADMHNGAILQTLMMFIRHSADEVKLQNKCGMVMNGFVGEMVTDDAY